MNKGSQIYLDRRRKNPRPMPPKAKATIAVFAVIAIAAAALAIFAKGPEKIDINKDGEIDAEALMTVVLPDETPSIIKDYNGFTVNFNPAHHQPNYVVWELTGQETDGKVPRASKFKTDSDVYGCATLDDYRNSGFDRGHMAPAGDLKWSNQAMNDSHYLTNICPQTHKLNGGQWSSLENKCRQWAQRDSAIIIIAGPILSDQINQTIGDSQVSIPERFFKVLLSPYSNPPRAIAFIMPNFPPYPSIEASTTSIDNVEEITGFDFFSALPDEEEEYLEAQANYRDWNRQKR